MTDQLALVLPEIVLLAAACLILVVDLFVTDKKRGITFLLTELTLFVAFFLSFDIWSTGAPSQVLFQGALVSDSLSHVLKLGIYLTSAIAILYARDYINARSFLRGEFYVLSLFAVLGMSILVSAVHLLTVYLGLELLSLSLYAMVAMRRDDSNAPEAAMKYFVMGAIASGFLLYGASLLYGTTGTLELSVISALDTSEPLVLFSMLFIMAGIAFKLGLVPFHMWVPDVYQGGPTAVVSFLAAAPKIAAFGLVYRVMVEGLNAWSADWQLVFGVMAVLSIAVGNVVALVQSNLKRLFAYSTIAHMGYFLLGIISGSDLGFAASLFYILTYAVISLGGFGLLLLMSRAGYECETL